MQAELGFCLVFLISNISGNFPVPDRWLAPPISSKDGNYTLEETITEGQSSEATTPFTTVKINNNPTFYTLLYQKYDIFYIDSSNLPQADVYLNNTLSLDYEQDPTLTLEITGGNPSGTGTIVLMINVIDVNDNTPVFESSLYQARISSLDGITAGSYVTNVKASDNDTGINSELTYAIQSGDQANSFSYARFSIDQLTGNISTTGHEFERSIYVLIITAMDNSTASRTGTTTLSVCINNIICGTNKAGNKRVNIVAFTLLFSLSTFFYLETFCGLTQI